jgi:hypothetical protein
MDTSIEKQTEINEWTYNSKREALFFSQLVFIGLSVLIFMYSLSKAGILSDILVLYVMIIVFVLLGIIWYTKYTYTRNSRDSHHWNKIVFSEDGKKPSTLSPTVLNSVATATAASCRAGASDTSSASGTSRASSASSASSASGTSRGSASGRTSSRGDRWGYNSWNDDTLGDVSTTNLNETQGIRYKTMRDRIDLPETVDSIKYCENNPSSYDPKTALPCKQVWCMANPTLSWKDPATSVSTPCKTLFTYL